MKRDTWVLLIVLAVLAGAAWWLWRKRQGVTSVGPITSVVPAPPVLSTVPPEVAASTGDVSYLAPTPIGTVSYVKGGLGVGGGGLLL